MELFSEEHSEFLLSKEWLVKSDSQTSTPYLFKFHSNIDDLSCCLIITDMKSVWAEVLTSAQFARRWRVCNSALALPYTEDSEEESAWRTETLQLLSRAHTLGAAEEVSFEIVQTTYADMAFELVYETFKWRWETCFLGHKTSAEIISKHIIFPLISLNHLAFSSPQAINDLSDADVEKTVDKVGRTARRSVDTHIKNAISKPRTASTLRRMTALVNFIPDLPRVISTAEKPELEVAQFERQHPKPPIHSHSVTVASPIGDISQSLKLSHDGGALRPPVPDDGNSATEESDGDDNVMNEKLPNVPSGSSPDLTHSQLVSRTTTAPRLSPMPTAPSKNELDSDSSPPRPVKKSKRPAPESSSDDSEEERKRRVAQLKGGSGSGSGGGKHGTRQPIKRGGKRF